MQCLQHIEILASYSNPVIYIFHILLQSRNLTELHHDCLWDEPHAGAGGGVEVVVCAAGVLVVAQPQAVAPEAGLGVAEESPGRHHVVQHPPPEGTCHTTLYPCWRVFQTLMRGKIQLNSAEANIYWCGAWSVCVMIMRTKVILRCTAILTQLTEFLNQWWIELHTPVKVFNFNDIWNSECCIKRGICRFVYFCICII